MRVEKIAEHGEELRLRVYADMGEMQLAFTDGLDAFMVQFNMECPDDQPVEEFLASAVGEEDAQGVIESAVINYLVPFALEEYGVMPISTYGIEADVSPSPMEAFSFDMTVLAKPEFELSSYEPLTVTVGPAPQVHERDIDAQVAMLAREFAAAKQNTTPDDPNLVVPVITDEWVAENMAAMNLSNVAELRQRFVQASEEELSRQYEQEKLSAAMEAYAKRFTEPLSKTMLAAMGQELYETFLAELASDGQTIEQFMEEQGLTEEEIHSSLEAQAENQLIQGFIMDAIYRHEDLALETSDLMVALHGIAPGREDETYDSMQKSGRVFLLKEAAARMKATAWILEHATFEVDESLGQTCNCGHNHDHNESCDKHHHH